MTVLQMKCFINLVNTKKQADTANILGIQPSTLSKYIEHLENEFSVKLFHKTSNGLELTKEGLLLYPDIHFMLKKYEDLITQIGKYSSKWQAKISIASMFHQPKLLKIVNDFSKLNPDIDLAISEITVSDVKSALDSQTVDAAIIYKEFLPKKYVNTIPMQEVNLIAVVNNSHPLADRDCISVSELKNEQFVLFKGDSPMYLFLLHTCINAGFVPNEINMDLRMYTIMDYLSNNMVVSLLMQNVVESFINDKLVAIPLKEEPKLTMSFICPAVYPSPAGEKLLEHIKKFQS